MNKIFDIIFLCIYLCVSEIGDDGVREYMSNVVGNVRLREKLCLDVLTDRLSHACILEGPTGTGKHTIAKNVAAALACKEKDSSAHPFPCTECIGCRKVLEGKSPDVITVRRAPEKATLGVEIARFIKNDVVTVPNDLDVKVYIIEEADKMTEEAQNALLLTLEEPPSFVRFILLCEHSELLLETIRSRAPVLRTEPIATEAIDEFICKADRRAPQMKLSSPREYDELLVAAKGGIGTALEYLEPSAFAPVLQRRALAKEFLYAASARQPKELIALISKFSSKRDVLTEQLTCLCEAVNDLVLIKKSDNAPLCFFEDRNTAIEISDQSSISFLYTLGEAVLTALDSISKNANLRLTLIKLLCDAELI